MPEKPLHSTRAAALRRGAVRRLKQDRRSVEPVRAVPNPRRLVQELQVHQIELEMQNAELQEARDRLETLLEKYTDLYDFAPIAYFSLDRTGAIRETNLTGAVLLGVDRSRLVGRVFERFVAPAGRPGFVTFLNKVFAGAGRQIAEMSLLNAQGGAIWAHLQAMLTLALSGTERWARVAVLDATALKRADEAQRRVEALAAANTALTREMARRHVVEASLRKSQRDQARLLVQSHHLQAQLRSLSHKILQAQEEERKRLSRELHDEVVQALVGINVHLGSLGRPGRVDTRLLEQKITRAQRLLRDAIDTVHRCARDLRPSVLDDLGLIPALHSYLKEFTRRTGTPVRFTAAAAVEKLGMARRTILYRVAQSALANVAQHAHATEVNVSIACQRDSVQLEVHDNGRAFDVTKVLLATRHQRLGVIGMRERVQMVGGHFSITSAPGQGTTVRAEVPVGPNGGTGR